MLRLIIGKAGTGKTAAIIAEIGEAVRKGLGGSMLIVPEQYSHEAERELSGRCGDSLSLYAEVFSFTGLARRVLQQKGGAAAPWLDKGGRLLCMALALSSLAPRLKLYGAASRRAELQAALLSAVDECKSAAVSPAMLLAASEQAEGVLSQKLWDLSLVLEGYDAVVANGRADPSERLDLLAGKIPASGIGRDHRIYIDGFIDFTRQEQAVVRALLATGAEVTVCLTLDELRGTDEVFALSRTAARRLLADAEELGCSVQIERMDLRGEKSSALEYFTDHLFGFSGPGWDGERPEIRLAAAPDLVSECELAAARAIELVREKGCRWRDIAVAVRGFEDYRRTLESVFAHYGVPLFTARKSELMQKPLPALIASAYEIVSGGWDVDDVASYMRTGLAGLSIEECDELENYLFLWQLRAPAWERESDWRQHPDGYGAEFNEETEERLGRINALRCRLGEPLRRFARSAKLARTAAGQAAALSNLLLDLKLDERLSQRAAALSAAGREELAAETAQLWEITVSALEQSAAVLGEGAMEADEFGRLFTLMLSRYDVGTIPVSLDRVSAGDFDRMRRRNIRHLIVLGASEQRLPAAEESGGVFSENERAQLLELDIDLGGGGESELWREFTLIYNCLSLPSESLSLSYSLTGGEGEQRPSFVMNRAASLFSLPIELPDVTDARSASVSGALSLAAKADRDGRARAAEAYFAETAPDRLDSLRRAAALRRGRLSEEAVRTLYGDTPRLSASQVDSFSSCKFAYFCRYGLRARPRESAAFRPIEIGSFIHAVLEQTAREVKRRGGFAAVEDPELRQIAAGAVERYVADELGGLEEKTERFRHLFARLRADVWRIVQDMAAELRRSDFEPLEFELNFSDASRMAPVLLGEGAARAQLVGIVDRVDGCVRGDRLYLRVVDYKTGKKSFSLSDVWYGLGLQMLLYLVALAPEGAEKDGRRVVPAGVMYVPARSALVAVDGEEQTEDVEKKLRDELRRSGLVLNDDELIEAWERGEDKIYLPVKKTRGKWSAESLATSEQMGRLYRHVRKTVADMAAELRAGTIAADPCFRSRTDNACEHCDYRAACRFAEGEAGEHSRCLKKLRPDEVWALMDGEGERDE
jgi:ATP-dependent helicase/nuclease subunit B